MLLKNFLSRIFLNQLGQMTCDINVELLKEKIRNIPNFPYNGINFKDITPLLSSRNYLYILTEMLLEKYRNKGITKVIGIESRGFFMASILAYGLNAGFVPIRKSGKLPFECFERKYKKEYGEDVIQIHSDSLTADDIVLIHDDLLATGGTILAAYELVKSMGVKHIYVNFLVELTHLSGRCKLPENLDVSSIFKLDS